MTSSLFFGGSVIAALIAGAIALFAPCCISVMLPAYFAGSFQNRRVVGPDGHILWQKGVLTNFSLIDPKYALDTFALLLSKPGRENEP